MAIVTYEDPIHAEATLSPTSISPLPLLLSPLYLPLACSFFLTEKAELNKKGASQKVVVRKFRTTI